MSDHVEEQEMEAEALSAIFDTHFTVTSDTQPFCWSVTLMPVPEEQEEEENHVIIELKATLPLDYPEISLPDLEIQVVKGLTEEHQTELLGLAQQEAQNNAGMPAIFAICEVLREWLVDHNVKGLDDVSMYSQMMRRTQEAERQEAQKQQEFEAQKQQEAMTEAEQEDLEVRRRRAEGTPCNKENFENWKRKFDAEMAELQQQQEAQEAVSSSKTKKGDNKKQDDKLKRLTGFEQFSDKQAGLSMEAIEAAAEQAENDEIDPDELDVDEDLFDVDDDELDDLDFDDEDDDVDYDDEVDDDDDEQPDI